MDDLAPDQLPNDVAAIQAIIARKTAELIEQTATLEDAKNQLKARDHSRLQERSSEGRACYAGSSPRSGCRPGHPRAFLEGFNGVLQADGFTGFNPMYEPDPLTQEVQVNEAGCWAHWRRRFFDFQTSIDSPIDPLVGARRRPTRAQRGARPDRQTLRGRADDQRQNQRPAPGHARRQKPPLDRKLKIWLEARLKELSEKFELTSAINYGLSGWDAFSLLLDDPAVAIDNNAAERAIRPLVIGRRNWTFAGSDRGAENAATIMTIIETLKLCDLNPQTYVADLLNRPPDHKINRLEDLAPWNWKPVQ